MEPLSIENNQPDMPDYLAFISYRHADNTEEDQQWATWLHQQLEVYDIPADLIGTTNLRGETIPERIYPVFRDEVSLPADADLSSSITQSLDRSRFLIVLCSPRAVQSHYVNQEILHFKRSGKQDKIIAAMICGEPNASIDDAKQEDPEDNRTLECFPEALRYQLSSNGELDKNIRTEPIAADFRLPDGSEGVTNPDFYKRQLLENGRRKADAERLAERYEEQLNTARLKIVAGILGVRLEQLTQRDKIHQLNKARAAARRFRRIAATMGVLTLAATVAGGLAYQQWQRADKEKNRAETLLGQVRGNLDFMNYKLRDVMEAYVPQDKRAPLMQRIDDIVNTLQETGNQSAADQVRTATSLTQKADLILQNSQLDPADALPLYQQSVAIFERLAKQQPENTQFQQNLSTLYGRLGNILKRTGDTKAALSQHQSSLNISQALVKRDPTDARLQRDLSITYNTIAGVELRLGNTEKALSQYQSSLKIRQTLVKKDPENDQFQRDLSVLHNKLGDILRRTGNTEDALFQYQSSLKIVQALVKRDPANTRFQRDLYISHKNMGNIQLQLGNLKEALPFYQSSLDITKTLAKKDPANTRFQHDLSVSYNKLGDILLRTGNLEEALPLYQSSLDISQALTAKDPENTQYKRALPVSYDRIGYIQSRLGNTEEALSLYQSSMEIIRSLLKADPENTELQYDLSVAYNKLGDMKSRLGMIETALSPYQASLEIRKKLVIEDPTNARYQRSLSTAYNELGDTQLQLGNTGKALSKYQSSLEIRHALAKADTGNPEYERDLSVVFFKLAKLYGTRKDYSLAHTNLVLAYDHLLRVQEMNALAPDGLKRLEAMEKGIQQLKALPDKQ